jgi:hypothetical protein
MLTMCIVSNVSGQKNDVFSKNVDLSIMGANSTTMR